MTNKLTHRKTVGTMLALTAATLAGQAQANNQAEPPSVPKPHLRIIVMDPRADIKIAEERNAVIDVCTAIGKVSLVATQSRARETVEQVVDCLYFNPHKKKPELMHVQFYQMLTAKAAPETDAIAELSIKAGFVPVQDIVAATATATRGTYVLSDKPLQFGKAMAAAVNMRNPDCNAVGCNTVATIADLGAFLKAGGIDTEKASAWQMVMPPQHYALPPEKVTGLSPAREPYRMGLRQVSFSM